MSGPAAAGAVFQRKTLLQLTWPLFVFSFLSMGTTFVDTILVSNYSEGLAATVSIANQILGVVYDLGGLMAVGVLVLVAQHLGRAEVGAARQVALVALAANTLLSFVLAGGLLAAGPWLVAWVNTPPEIAADARLYLAISAGAIACNGFVSAATAVLRGFGHTVEILVLGVLANGLYLFLEVALIYGRFGFPELGVAGAALSTLAVRLSGVVLLVWVLQRRLGFRWEWPTLPRCFAVGGRLLKISFPSVGDNVLYNIYQLRLVAFIAVLGTGAVLARSYVLAATAFLSLIAYVISQGNETLVGYDKGAGDHEAARRRATRTALLTAAVTALLAAVLYAASDAVIGLFTKDPAVLRDARTLLLLTIILQPLSAITLLLLNALRAVGDVFVPAGFSIAVTWLVALPLAWWLIGPAGFGVTGLWAALIAEEACKAAFFAFRWHRMRWVRYHPIDPTPA